jgi:hypothetical protein
VLAPPAGRLLDAGFRPAPAGGAGLVALGGVLRLGGQTFAWAMAGQVAVAVAERLSGPTQAATGAIVWLAGNLGGLVVALVEALVHHPTPAFRLGAPSLPALVLAERFRPSRSLRPGESALTS